MRFFRRSGLSTKAITIFTKGIGRQFVLPIPFVRRNKTAYIDYYEPPESELSYLTEEEKKNAYYLFQADDKNLPKVGGEYLLLLRNTDTDIPAVIGTFQGIFRIEGDKAYQTESGPAISLEELLQMVAP